MSAREEMGRASSRASQARDDLDRASQDLRRAAEHAGDATADAKDGLRAGASGMLESAKETLGSTRKKAGHVAGRIAGAESDSGLERKADSKTEKALNRTGEAMKSAAPTVGRGSEKVLSTTGKAMSGAAPMVGRGVETTMKVTGAALHKLAGPLGTAVGAIAGKVGGWWGSASDAMAELPEEEEQTCRVHFEAYTTRPAEMTYDDARTAYLIGYIAARNPAYTGRHFDDIEADLRYGLDAGGASAYDPLRDFARFGYERARGGGSERVTIR